MKQTKAILVIDMPEDCLDCPCVNPELWCQVSGKCIKTEYKPRPKWCPLRPLPDSKKVIASGKVKVVNYLYANGFADGFNACLDEITGDKE